jgi:hypothetical protein
MTKAQILFDSQSNDNTGNWYIVDDVVMGGQSNGQLQFTEEGYAQFSGTISLENNGGFSSVRCVVPKVKVSPENTVRIQLKGDGSNFQFRVKSQRGQYYSYIQRFETTGEWQTHVFRLNDLYPTFRGRRLDLPNFNHDCIEEITFLIGNKVAQEFELLISKIELLD